MAATVEPPDDVKVAARQSSTRVTKRESSLAMSRRVPAPASFHEWRERKRHDATAVRRQREADCERLDHSPHVQHIEALRLSREAHAVSLSERRAHSLRHTRNIRLLEGRADDGRGSVPHWVAMQAAMAEQDRQRDMRLAAQRQTSRAKREAERRGFLNDVPSRQRERIERIVSDAAASAVARFLVNIGACGGASSTCSGAESPQSPNPNPELQSTSGQEQDRRWGWDEGVDSADDIPDPGWFDVIPPRPRLVSIPCGTSASAALNLSPPRSMTPEERERAHQAAAAAAREFALPDPHV